MTYEQLNNEILFGGGYYIWITTAKWRAAAFTGSR